MNHIRFRKKPGVNILSRVRDEGPVGPEPAFSSCLPGGSLLLNCGELLDRIIEALDKRSPLSVVSVGATEAFAMAQYTIYSEDEIIKHPEALIANRGVIEGFEHRGIRFPDAFLRDTLVEAVRKSDIIGYNTIVDDARELAEKVFEVYGIKPSLVFEANLRRVFMFSHPDKFEEMLAGRRLLLIGSLAAPAAEALNRHLKPRLRFNIVGTIPIFEFHEVPLVKESIAQFDFDLCLLAAGANAVILSQHIAETYGKVAFDIGWGMKSFFTGKVETDAWVTSIIGIEHLLQM